MERDDVAAAVGLLGQGTLTPDAERPDDEDAYWSAVLETRARGGEMLVADLDDVVVGICQVMILRHFQHAGGRCAEIESVHVRSDLRSRGIGASLLDEAERIARDAGCYRIQLTSRTVRTDAHRFYVANGYEHTSLGFKKLLVDFNLA
jgi:GNAT superfamily N-acetyltransferase